MTIRLHVGTLLAPGLEFALPDSAARHAQVRRVQPGDTLQLFDGRGSDWPAEVLAMGRHSVQVRVGAAQAVQRELPLQVTLALAMPANERMDALVEKATELGVAAIQPLLSERSVLRLAGERAQRKQQHWQAIAAAACEQCGRAVLPVIAPVQRLADWLAQQGADMGAAQAAAAQTDPAQTDPTQHARWLLSLQPDARAPAAVLSPALRSVTTLNGPEGGLTPDEEDAARRQGFVPLALGPRVLRADTAPLALLAWLGLALG